MSLTIDQLRKIRGANQPWRFLSTKPEHFAREQLCGRSTTRLLATQAKVFWCDLIFSPEVEAEYVRTHLLGSRLLIHVTCALAAVLAVARAVEQTATGFPVGGPAIALAVVIIASVLLASLAWSSAFERLFLSFAR